MIRHSGLLPSFFDNFPWLRRPFHNSWAQSVPCYMYEYSELFAVKYPILFPILATVICNLLVITANKTNGKRPCFATVPSGSVDNDWRDLFGLAAHFQWPPPWPPLFPRCNPAIVVVPTGPWQPPYTLKNCQFVTTCRPGSPESR